MKFALLLALSLLAGSGLAQEAYPAEPLTSTPEEFSAYLKKEIVKWGDVIRRAGVKAD